MRRDADRIGDILEAADTILRLTEGHTAETFAADDVLVSACFFHALVLGEAVRALKADPHGRIRRTDAPLITANPSLPWQGWIAMRNLVIHRYHGRDERYLWEDIRGGDLERLAAACRVWLARP